MKWIAFGLLNLLLTSTAFSDVKQVSFKNNYCVCKDGKAVSYGNCASTCAEHSDTYGSEILFANFTFIPGLRHSNTREWCNVGVGNPRCELEAKDESGNVQSFHVTFLKRNSILVSVDSLDYEKIHVLTLKEVTTGKTSDSVQLIKTSLE